MTKLIIETKYSCNSCDIWPKKRIHWCINYFINLKKLNFYFSENGTIFVINPNMDFPTFPGLYTPITLVCRGRGTYNVPSWPLMHHILDVESGPLSTCVCCGPECWLSRVNCSQPLYKINQEIQRQTRGRGNVRSWNCLDGGNVSRGCVGRGCVREPMGCGSRFSYICDSVW